MVNNRYELGFTSNRKCYRCSKNVWVVATYKRYTSLLNNNTLYIVFAIYTDESSTQMFAPFQDSNIKYMDGELVEDKMHNPLGDVDDVERRATDNLNENLKYSESDSDDEYNPATEKDVIFYCSFYSNASSMDNTNDEICN